MVVEMDDLESGVIKCLFDLFQILGYLVAIEMPNNET